MCCCSKISFSTFFFSRGDSQDTCILQQNHHNSFSFTSLSCFFWLWSTKIDANDKCSSAGKGVRKHPSFSWVLHFFSFSVNSKRTDWLSLSNCCFYQTVIQFWKWNENQWHCFLQKAVAIHLAKVTCVMMQKGCESFKPEKNLRSRCNDFLSCEDHGHSLWNHHDFCQFFPNILMEENQIFSFSQCCVLARLLWQETANMMISTAMSICVHNGTGILKHQQHDRAACFLHQMLVWECAKCWLRKDDCSRGFSARTHDVGSHIWWWRHWCCGLAHTGLMLRRLTNADCTLSRKVSCNSCDCLVVCIFLGGKSAKSLGDSNLWVFQSLLQLSKAQELCFDGELSCVQQWVVATMDLSQLDTMPQRWVQMARLLSKKSFLPLWNSESADDLPWFLVKWEHPCAANAKGLRVQIFNVSSASVHQLFCLLLHWQQVIMFVIEAEKVDARVVCHKTMHKSSCNGLRRLGSCFKLNLIHFF